MSDFETMSSRHALADAAQRIGLLCLTLDELAESSMQLAGNDELKAARESAREALRHVTAAAEALTPSQHNVSKVRF